MSFLGKPQLFSTGRKFPFSNSCLCKNDGDIVALTSMESRPKNLPGHCGEPRGRIPRAVSARYYYLNFRSLSGRRFSKFTDFVVHGDAKDGVVLRLADPCISGRTRSVFWYLKKVSVRQGRARGLLGRGGLPVYR